MYVTSLTTRAFGHFNCTLRLVVSRAGGGSCYCVGLLHSTGVNYFCLSACKSLQYLSLWKSCQKGRKFERHLEGSERDEICAVGETQFQPRPFPIPFVRQSSPTQHQTLLDSERESRDILLTIFLSPYFVKCPWWRNTDRKAQI